MEQWNKVLVKPDDKIALAIELLEKVSLRIVLVVNEKNVLLGTITDGDVRRGLIKHITLESSVIHVMQTRPLTIKKGSTRALMRALMQKNSLLHIPILDDQSHVVGIETLQSLNEKQKRENPVVLMAGGFGKRLHPMTLNVPKPLLSIGDKPILQIILEQFIEVGFSNFFISVHYKSEQVCEYFGNGEDWGVSIKYIHEDVPLGTAGALSLLPSDLPMLPIIIMNGDILTKINLIEFLEYHERLDGIATMCVREYDFQVPYGVVKATEHRVQAILEKPAYRYFVNAGIYLVEPSVYKELNKKEYLDMTDLLQSLIDHDEHINMFPIYENWLDIGRMEDYQVAQFEVNKP